MNKTLLVSSSLFLCLVWVATRALDIPGTAPAAAVTLGAAGTDSGVGKGIATAAKDLLGSLDDRGKKSAVFTFDDEERFNWHFIPRARKGLPLKDMTDRQKAGAKALLQSGLSTIGYEKTEQVRMLDGILRDLEGAQRRFSRDPEEYFVSIFGQPGEGRWGWRFEGHHLALNFTLDGERLVSATPLFYGANPSVVRSGPNVGLRVLGGAEDIARDLVNSLDESQRRVALGEKPEEVKATQSARYNETLPEGVTGADLKPAQKELLRKLIAEYTQSLKKETRDGIHEEIDRAGIDKIYFAWRGGLRAFEGHSYMIHGPALIISYSNFQNGATHVHAALRTVNGEFGLGASE